MAQVPRSPYGPSGSTSAIHSSSMEGNSSYSQASQLPHSSTVLPPMDSPSIGSYLDLGSSSELHLFNPFNSRDMSGNSVVRSNNTPVPSFPIIPSPSFMGSSSLSSTLQVGRPSNSSRTDMGRTLTTNNYLHENDQTSFNDQAVFRTPQRVSRKTRLRQPSEARWEGLKPRIKELYMDENQPLTEVMREMEKTHQFVASIKMYKDRFKVWHWSKNLPNKKALWMQKRINERKPQQLVFEYNGQEWSEERLRKILDSLPEEARRDGVSPAGPTPSDIQYNTVLSVVSDSPSASESDPVDNLHARELDFDAQPSSFDLSQMSMSDLRQLLQSATATAAAGLMAEAEAQYRDALLGFRHLLSPTHDETLRAGYRLASFYANQGRMNEVDSLLNWMTSCHRTKWGASHTSTILHYARVIDLFRSCGRREHAEIMLYKLMDNTNNLEDVLNSVTSRGSGQGPRSSNGNTNYSWFSESYNPSTISHQLQMIDLSLAVNIRGPVDVLPRIIENCEGCPDGLGPQEVRAKCVLARLYITDGNINEARRVLSSAKGTMSRLLIPDEDFFPPRVTVDAARRLAFMFFDAGDEQSCNAVLEEVISVLQARPRGTDVELKGGILIDFLLSLASEFHHKSTWDKCKPWLELALGIAIKEFGWRSPDTKRFEKMLALEKFEYRSSEHVQDLMDYSKGLFRIRLD